MKRIVGAVALLAGAALTGLATTRSLYETTRVDSGFRSGYRMTLWGGEYTTPDGLTELADIPIRFGVPAVVAAVLLVPAAVLLLASPRLPARVGSAARVGSVVAAGLLVGSVWTVGQEVLSATGKSDPVGGTIVATASDGIWLLVAAAVAAVAGALLVQGRPTVYQLPDDDDTDTPPMGTPIHPSVSTEESSPG